MTERGVTFVLVAIGLMAAIGFGWLLAGPDDRAARLHSLQHACETRGGVWRESYLPDGRLAEVSCTEPSR